MKKSVKSTKHKYVFTGYQPAVSKEHNRVLRAFDLGIEGAFVKFYDHVTFRIKPGYSLRTALDTVKKEYRKLGCIEVTYFPYKL